MFRENEGQSNSVLHSLFFANFGDQMEHYVRIDLAMILHYNYYGFKNA